MNSSLQSNLSPKGDSSKTGESQVVRNLNDEQNQQASFSGRPTTPTKLEPPANLDLSPTHDESTVGQKLLSNFDVSTIATNLPPSTGNNLENPSSFDDTPRTITLREEKSMGNFSGEESVNLEESFADHDPNHYGDPFQSHFVDPFQSLYDNQITTFVDFEDSSKLHYGPHQEDVDKIFMHEKGADDHPDQPDSLPAPETITGFPKTIRDEITKFFIDQSIRQSSSSGTVVADRKRERSSSIDASSVPPEKKARRETRTIIEISITPQLTRKGLSVASDSDPLAPHGAEGTSRDLPTDTIRVTLEQLEYLCSKRASLSSSIRNIRKLIGDNLGYRFRIPSCGFFDPYKFTAVMSSLCESSYKNAFPKTIIGIGSGRGFLEKCFELMGGLNVKCYDREPCNEFIPVELAEFPKDIDRILPNNCSSSVLVAGYPQGYLGPVLSEFIQRGGKMLCTTVEGSLFADVHAEYEDDPDILRKAISELTKMNGEFFQVKLNSYNPMLETQLPKYIQFYNWSPTAKQAIFKCPELSGFCSNMEFPPLFHTGSPRPDLKRIHSHDGTA